MMRSIRDMERIRTSLYFVGRIIFGSVLAIVLGVVGIGIAWSMFVFWGASSHTTLLLMFFSGAGIGASSGTFLAWFRVDRLPSFPVMTLMWVLLSILGGMGAVLGYQFGAKQEVECCVGPALNPIAYMTIGTAIATNVVALIYGLIRECRLQGLDREHNRNLSSLVS